MSSFPDDRPRTGTANIKDSLRPPLPKRFYKEVAVAARDNGFAVLLDGRPVRTPAKRGLVLPAAALAEAIAEEWRSQAALVDPATMPMTRIVNSALDGVSGREAEVAADIVKYAGSDLLFYRADGPDTLVARQSRLWNPILAWAEGWLGGRFILSEGIMPVTQPATTLARIADKVAAFPAMPLATLHVITTLTGSSLLALAHANRYITAEAVWAAAHVDEDHQADLWGRDAEAEARRAGRWTEMKAASRLLALSSA